MKYLLILYVLHFPSAAGHDPYIKRVEVQEFPAMYSPLTGYSSSICSDRGKFLLGKMNVVGFTCEERSK